MALWTPADTITALWLDAADSSTIYDAVSGGSLVAPDGVVARWEDKSGNARHATQGTSLNRPLRKLAVQNSLDVLRFDGSNDRLSISDLGLFRNIGFAAIAVAARVEAANQFIFGAETNAGSTRAGLSTTLVVNTRRSAVARRLDANAATSATSSISTAGQFRIQIGVFRFADGTIESRDNGADIKTSFLPSSGNTSDTDSTAISVGSIASAFFANGDISEVIVFVSAISESQILTVEGYLSWKWGTQGSLPANHPYKNAAPTTGGSGAAAVHFFTFGF